MNIQKYSNLEIIIEKALSTARMELDPCKNDFNNKFLLVEIDTLQWILNLKVKIFNNLNILKEIVQNEIYNLRLKYIESINKQDIYTLSKSIEILQTCLFLIKMELEVCKIDKRGNNK